MGACIGRCCPKIGFQWKRTFFGASSTSYDQANLVEFDMMSSPNFEEPISISSMLSLRRKRNINDGDDGVKTDRAIVEARFEAELIARTIKTNTEQVLINPARLVFKGSSSPWGTDPIDNDPNDINDENELDDDDAEFLIDENRLRLLTSRTYLPSHSFFLDTGSSTVSSVNGKDWMHEHTNTPPSSLDLEWDEAGVFLPSESNKNSTPASNDFEWDDDDFDANSEVDDVHNGNTTMDVETEQLITEIERLTSDVLNETNHGYR